MHRKLQTLTTSTGTTTTETAVIAAKLFSKTYTIDQSTNAPWFSIQLGSKLCHYRSGIRKLPNRWWLLHPIHASYASYARQVALISSKRSSNAESEFSAAMWMALPLQRRFLGSNDVMKTRTSQILTQLIGKDVSLSFISHLQILQVSWCTFREFWGLFWNRLEWHGLKMLKSCATFPSGNLKWP